MQSKQIYFAGGCFWGIQKLFQNLPGIIQTQCGYVNGREDITPNYKRVCQGDTEYKECVFVEFDPAVLSLEKLLKVFFYVIDPTQKDGQAHDIGSQYHTGIYCVDQGQLQTVQTYVESIQSSYSNFETEIGYLKNFFTAEEYHQDYLLKNPTGYCHIPTAKYEEVKKMVEEK